ncbi:MAG: hypothetical protein HY875_17070 [Chloroflexi bacterium]|nr:hypothetical protein [Chloroflexota bacterium]
MIIWGPLGPEDPEADSDEEESRRVQEVFVYEPLARAGQLCSDCGEPLNYPMVLWSFSTDVFLHPLCATRVGQCLLFDAKIALKPDLLDINIRRRHRLT